jgi:hypothetical protein
MCEQAVASGELEQFLQHLGGESPFRAGGRLGSLGMAKLESMELPDAAAAVAMLHDMPEARLAAGIPRANSGLESMQSIEQALGNVEQVRAVCISFREPTSDPLSLVGCSVSARRGEVWPALSDNWMKPSTVLPLFCCYHLPL